ncbi:MAG: serine hydrolase [Bacteroidetes bacterium]|nr:serine hydrolase [Bacteroidota bacterium]
MNKLFKLLGITAMVMAVLFFMVKVRGDEHLYKALWACYLHGNSSATIDDAKFFDTHTVEAAKEKQDWPTGAAYNQPVPEKLQKVFDKTGTVAFLVIKNDSIISEHYWDNYSDSSQSNSFSMAKSMTTMLAQIAIQKNILTGWHQRVNSILPRVKGPHAAELELWHLSTMSSGLDWEESYQNPWSVTARAYYGTDIQELMYTLPIKDTPGQAFNYQSGSTQLLAMCLMQATGKSLSELASEWLWQPLQTTHDATWHTDTKGNEMAYCCFNSNARDFARLGKMMLHRGNFNGTQVLDSAFVQLATTGALAPHYGYSFWIDETQGTKAFFQWGFCGQYIITVPEHNLVMVRLGTTDMVDPNEQSEYCRVLVKEVLEMTIK